MDDIDEEMANASVRRRTALRPEFLGYALNLDRQRGERSPEAQRALLGIGRVEFRNLHLCRMPASLEDVCLLAGYVNCDPIELLAIAQAVVRELPEV